MRCACGDEGIQGTVRFQDLSLVESCKTRSEGGGMEGRLATSGFYGYYHIELRLPAGSSAKQSHWDRRWSLPRKNDTSHSGGLAAGGDPARFGLYGLSTVCVPCPRWLGKLALVRPLPAEASALMREHAPLCCSIRCRVAAW